MEKVSALLDEGAISGWNAVVRDLNLFLSILKKGSNIVRPPEVFTTLTEARVLTEEWRNEYNQIRPHSALGYQPPAPEVIISLTLT